MPSTGEIVQQSGIYACTKCKNEVTSVKGERFPPCAKCRGTNFTLIRAIAVLAFEKYKSDNDLDSIEEIKERLNYVREKIKKCTPAFMELQIIIAEDIPAFREFPLELGPWGDATIDFLNKM